MSCNTISSVPPPLTTIALLTPKAFNASAMVLHKDLSYTPKSWIFGLKGLIKGPKQLKIVLVKSSFLKGADFLKL